jgi:tol-pal system protein YbgF
MTRLITVAFIATLMAGLASTSAQAESTKDQLNAINGRLEKIERVLTNQSLLDLEQRLDQVQNDVRELRGRLDELENSMQKLRKQQESMRNAQPPSPPPAAAAPPVSPAAAAAQAAFAGSPVERPATGTGAGASGTSPSSSDPPTVSEDETVYKQDLDALRAGAYSVAATGFKDFVAHYPSSPLAPSAQYWLGQTYYVTHEYEAAASAFRTVLQKWPDDRKAPDAMLGLGNTQNAMKRGADARATLTQVAQKYPGTDAAKRASDMLQRMGSGN